MGAGLSLKSCHPAASTVRWSQRLTSTNVQSGDTESWSAHKMPFHTQSTAACLCLCRRDCCLCFHTEMWIKPSCPLHFDSDCKCIRPFWAQCCSTTCLQMQYAKMSLAAIRSYFWISVSVYWYILGSVCMCECVCVGGVNKVNLASCCKSTLIDKYLCLWCFNINEELQQF